MSEASTWTWRDAGGLVRVARWLLYAMAAFSALSAVLRLLGMGDDEKTITAFVAVVVLVKAALFIATVIVVLRWSYVSNANARALGADDLSGSPGWSVGWWFIPFLQLAMPYMTVRDTWKASANPKDWQAESTPGLVPLWWTCWLIGLLSLSAAGQLEDEGALQAASVAQTLRLVSDIAWIPSAILLAMIIERIQAIQLRTRTVSIY